MWTVLHIFWFVGIPASTIFFLASIFLNDVCTTLESASASNFTDFKYFNDEMRNIIKQCKTLGDGDILNNFGFSLPNDFSIISGNDSLPSKLTSEISLLGNTTLSLPHHVKTMSSYTNYYSIFLNLEVIYGSSLSTLLLNAGTELSLMFGSTTVVYDSAVTVVGSKTIATLWSGVSGPTGPVATYTSGSGTASLVFTLATIPNEAGTLSIATQTIGGAGTMKDINATTVNYVISADIATATGTKVVAA